MTLPEIMLLPHTGDLAEEFGFESEESFCKFLETKGWLHESSSSEAWLPDKDATHFMDRENALVLLKTTLNQYNAGDRPYIYTIYFTSEGYERVAALATEAGHELTREAWFYDE